MKFLFSRDEHNPRYFFYRVSCESTIHTHEVNFFWSDEELYFFKKDIYLYYLNTAEFKTKFKKNELKSYTLNKHLTERTQFMKILKRDGLYVKYWLLVTAMSTMHRHYFERLNTHFNTVYADYISFRFLAETNPQFFDLDFLLAFITSFLNPCVQMKVVRFPKFLQKKLRKKYNFKIKHVPLHLRKRYVYKRIIIYSGFINYKKLLDRVYISLVETFLNPENNPLHKERLNFYKHTLKLYRFGKLNLHAL